MKSSGRLERTLPVVVHAVELPEDDGAVGLVGDVSGSHTVVAVVFGVEDLDQVVVEHGLVVLLAPCEKQLI